MTEKLAGFTGLPRKQTLPEPGLSSGGMVMSARRPVRAVNAVGSREQKKLLAASNSPDLWASDVSVTAGLHSRTNGFGVFGAFGAYLFDSKFHVPPTGRSVFSLGIRKAFG